MQGGEEARGPLTPDELGRLRTDIEAFTRDAELNQDVLALGGSMLRVRAALDILKQLCQEGRTATQGKRAEEHTLTAATVPDAYQGAVPGENLHRRCTIGPEIV